MGWSSGTYIAEVFAEIILKYVPVKDRKKVGKKALEYLVDQDWDCIEEVEFFDWIDGLSRQFKDDFDTDEDWEEYQQRMQQWEKKFNK